jgi:hypothetical protein
MAKQLSEHTRLVDKKGRNQVSFKDMEEQSAMYMKDIFTTFVDAHWYYVLIAFFASFFGKNELRNSVGFWVCVSMPAIYNNNLLGLWLLFGLFYWAIAWHHNDIQAYNSPQNFTDHTYICHFGPRFSSLILAHALTKCSTSRQRSSSPSRAKQRSVMASGRRPKSVRLPLFFNSFSSSPPLL